MLILGFCFTLWLCWVCGGTKLELFLNTVGCWEFYSYRFKIRPNIRIWKVSYTTRALFKAQINIWGVKTLKKRFSLPVAFSFLVFFLLPSPIFLLMQWAASSSFILVLILSSCCLYLSITLFQFIYGCAKFDFWIN